MCCSSISGGGPGTSLRLMKGEVDDFVPGGRDLIGHGLLVLGVEPRRLGSFVVSRPGRESDKQLVGDDLHLFHEMPSRASLLGLSERT